MTIYVPMCYSIELNENGVYLDKIYVPNMLQYRTVYLNRFVFPFQEHSSQKQFNCYIAS